MFDGLFFMCDFIFFYEKGVAFWKGGNSWGGEALGVSEARFSPSSSPFPGTPLFCIEGMCECTGEVMDAALSESESLSRFFFR